MEARKLTSKLNGRRRLWGVSGPWRRLQSTEAGTPDTSATLWINSEQQHALTKGLCASNQVLESWFSSQLSSSVNLNH